MKKLVTLVATMILGVVIASPAFAVEANADAKIVKDAANQPVEPFRSLAFSKMFTVNPMKPGWQHVGTDAWHVDNHTITGTRSMAGGGVRACFRGLAYRYSVQLWENDPFSPDDKIGGVRHIPKRGKCRVWRGVNTEPGHEELYLEFTKSSKKKDIVTVKWYD